MATIKTPESASLLPALALAASLLTLCAVTQARDLDQDEALRLRQQGVILALEQVLQQAMSLYPGARLLEAELEEHDKRYIYEVELLTPTHVVREIKIDARTGEVIADKEDD